MMTKALLGFVLLLPSAPAPFPKKPIPVVEKIHEEYFYHPGYDVSYRIVLFQSGKYRGVRYPDYQQYEGTWKVNEGGQYLEIIEKRVGFPSNPPYHWLLKLQDNNLRRIR